MRESDTCIESQFNMRTLEDIVPAVHPLRPIRRMVNAALLSMNDKLSRLYADPLKGGRPSITAEKLLCTMHSQVFYIIRSESQLVEHSQYNLLFRGFIGLAMDFDVWVLSVFRIERERLVAHDAIVEFFNRDVERVSTHMTAFGRALQRLSQPDSSLCGS